MTTNIIFFTQLYYPDMATTATIMTDLVEDLASYGMNTEVVCAQPTYVKSLGIEGFRDSGVQACPPSRALRRGGRGLRNSGSGGSVDLGKFPKVELRNGVGIRRVWTFLFDKNKNIGRILNSTSCFFSMLLRVLSTRNNSLLVFNTNPALLSLLGCIGAKLRSQRYVVLVHDLWPELPAHIGMIKEGGVLYTAIEFVNKLSFRYASRIVVLSEAMKSRVLGKVPEMDGSVRVIHNWVDANRVFPVARGNNRLLKELGLQDKKVVMFSGNLGRYQPLEVMIGAANELKDRNYIFFLFAGEGRKKQKIQKMAASLNLDNVKFLPFQPLDRLAESLSMADVALIGIYPENNGVIMPSKLYSLLAVGRPIICVSDHSSDVVEILEKAKAGLYASIDDPKELAQKITDLLDNPEKAQELGQNGKRYFLEHFERKKMSKQWKDVLEGICH